MSEKDDTREAKYSELQELLEGIKDHQTRRQIEWYSPVPKQMEFHKLGNQFRERMLMAGNQLGKSLSAGMEVAMHLTGEYPDWWPGIRFRRETHWWVAGVTGESTRDNPQRILLGRGRNWGTGTLPSSYLHAKPMMARGNPDAVDSVQVVHKNGGVSTLKFKSYDQGREKWQGDTLDGIWFDEEPPEDIYVEGLTRLNRRKGHALITFTPLLGMTAVVKRFYEPQLNDPGRKSRALVHMTLEDATFYSKDEQKQIDAQYSPAMKRARTQGLPMFGEGLIYPYDRETIECEPFTIPSFYRRICGLDHGIQHPAALVWIAYNPDTDTVYVYDLWKQSDTTIADRVGAWKHRGDWIPVAWPHDVGVRDKGVTGKPFAQLYSEHGMLMLPRSARIDPESGGAQPREPIIQNMAERMQTGRLKVFSNLNSWFSEQQQYHRKDGQVVAENDDLISATHYALMELRNAEVEKRNWMQTVAEGTHYNPLTTGLN
mgnify:FL=1